MKKNEAISILATSQRPREPKDRARYDEAVKMAIDALNKSQPDTTTHDSIPAKTGKNDGDGTSGDCISRRQSVDTLRKMQTYKLFAGDDMLLIDQAEAQTELMMLPSVQPEHMHTVMLKIAEKYEKAMNTSCILNPMAWALYQTWKEYDR